MQTYADHSSTRAGLNRGPLPLSVALMCPETFPAEAKSVRLFVIHDDLKPPQTTSRRADLEMGLHRRLCRTEIPATENSML